MKITKLKIKNLFGISEYEAGDKSVELSGKNGTGKTSVIDAIRFALTNKSERDYIVRNGESEGEIFIETDSGLTIDRKSRTNKSDYKSIKSSGKQVPNPESFLRDIFTELQLNPVEFMSMDKKKQNAIILDMIEFDWDINWIKNQFGEIVPDINYEQNILQVLNDIQAENGYYFTTRQDLNRDIRNKRAFVTDIASTLPVGYEADKWANANLGDIYKQIETIRSQNERIEKARTIVDNRDNKVRKFEADKEIQLTALEREMSSKRNQIDRDIASLEEQIRGLKSEKLSLGEKEQDKKKLIEQEFKTNIAEYDAQVKEYEDVAKSEVRNVSNLVERADYTEKMKSHLNEYTRMKQLQTQVEELVKESEVLTAKIEHARLLPGEILQTANIPINGLSVKDGIPLINGLSVTNLSEGEKLDLCIDVAVQKPNALQIILIDGVEKLSTENRKRLYDKCKSKGLQFIATRTTDDDDLTIMEL